MGSSSGAYALDVSILPYEGTPVDGSLAVMNTGTLPITVIWISIIGGPVIVESWGIPCTLAPGGIGDIAITSDTPLIGSTFFLETSAGTFGPYLWPDA